jgi:hypothetical protein
VLVIIALFGQELLVLGEILLENFILEGNIFMPFVSLTAIEEIQRELESQVKDVIFCHRHKVVLTSCHSTNDVDKWDTLARAVGMHLYLHVPLEVPGEDVMLEGFRLSECELDDVRLASRKYLCYHSFIQVERYPLDMSVVVPYS